MSDPSTKQTKLSQGETDIEQQFKASWFPAKSSAHFVAGGLGGMCGGIVTAPFDVVKTRLQSDLYNPARTSSKVAGKRGLLHHFVDTGSILRDTYKYEGFRALFRGLGPTLVGVIPARSINFFAYGNGKQMIAYYLNEGKESSWVHLLAAANAGIWTATATNPIWVVKTRLQLAQRQAKTTGPIKTASPYTVSLFNTSHSFGSTVGAHTLTTQNPAVTNTISTSATSSSALRNLSSSLSCISHIWKTEGIQGFYRGLSASYLGVTEGVIQWTLYEQLKRKLPNGDEGFGQAAAAGLAKLAATCVTYPHEVVRTRLRQSPPPGQPAKYVGLINTFKIVWTEEGLISMYGGLSAHLLRVVPNAICMYYVYETVLKWSGVSIKP